MIKAVARGYILLVVINFLLTEEQLLENNVKPIQVNRKYNIKRTCCK